MLPNLIREYFFDSVYGFRTTHNHFCILYTYTRYRYLGILSKYIGGDLVKYLREELSFKYLIPNMEIGRAMSVHPTLQ